jgi:hypothetical protein
MAIPGRKEDASGEVSAAEIVAAQISMLNPETNFDVAHAAVRGLGLNDEQLRKLNQGLTEEARAKIR